MSTKGKITNMSSYSTSSDATSWIPFRQASQPMKSPFMPSDEEEEEEILDVKPLAIIYPSDEEEGHEDPKSSKSAKPRKPKMKGRGEGKKK